MRSIEKSFQVQQSIIVKLQIQGLHAWEDCTIPDVAFLKNQHRHIFYIECQKKVSHSDREIEIIKFKNDVLNFFKSRYVERSGIFEFGNLSCEMIAAKLLKYFNLSKCCVLEDNENGAIVEVCEYGEVKNRKAKI